MVAVGPLQSLFLSYAFVPQIDIAFACGTQFLSPLRAYQRVTSAALLRIHNSSADCASVPVFCLVPVRLHTSSAPDSLITGEVPALSRGQTS